MASVLKKLSAFVPTMEDTVGNLDGVVATQAPAVESPITQHADMDEGPVGLGQPAIGEAQPTATAAGSANARLESRHPKAAKAGRRRVADSTGETQRNKDGSLDMRFLRRTGRTMQMSLKLRPDLPDAMKLAAYEEGISLGELMEQMWAAYDLQRHGRRARSS